MTGWAAVEEMDEEDKVEIGEGEVGIFPIDENGNRSGKPVISKIVPPHSNPIRVTPPNLLSTIHLTLPPFTPFNPTITPSTTSIPKKRRKGDPSKIGVPGYSKHGVSLGRKSRSTERKEEEEKENIDKKKLSTVTQWLNGSRSWRRMR